jgi:Putative transposase
MIHHPHIHMIVPGGGISLDSQHWVSSRPAFLLPVRVLGSLFRRLFLNRLIELHRTGRLGFFGIQAGLADHRLFLHHLTAVRKKRWVVYAKPPFTGPEAVLAYLSRYTHRVAISNQRLIAFDEAGVTFRYRDYRLDGSERQRVMTLTARVHPPLLAPCPATWRPPHPALRLARQFGPQGQLNLSPRTTCRGFATRASRSTRAPRLTPTLSLPRWPHDHR